jgi:hypothetical protein
VRKVDFQGKQCNGKVLNFTSSEPEWLIIKVEDGTVIKVKLLLTEIIRAVGEHYENGEPGYLYSYNIMQSIVGPDALQKENEVLDKKKVQ